MPKVPVYNEQIQQASPRVVGPQLTTPMDVTPATNAVMQATQGLGQAIGKFGDLLARRIEDHEQMKAQRRAAEQDDAFRNEVNSLLYNDEIEEVTRREEENGLDSIEIREERPKGFFLRQGETARGSTIEFQSKVEPIRQKYLSQAKNQYQRDILNKSIGNYYTSVREQMLKHEATQIRGAYNQAIESNVKRRILDAGAITQPKLLADELEQIGGMIAERDDRMGVDPETSALNFANTSAAVVENSVNSMLAKDAKKAQQLFDGVKDKLPKAHQDKIQSTIDSKTIFDKSVTVWGEVKDLKLADGSPNIEAMQTAILGMKGYKPEQKAKIFDFVQSKAAEAETFRKAKLHADDIALQNEFIKIKRDPESDNKFEKGLAIIAKLGGDNITMANRRKILEETLNKEGLGNKALAYEYIKKAENGQTQRGEIETAYTDGRINLSQRNTALDALNKYDTGSEDKAKKRVDQKIEALIKEDYKDKKEQAEILYQYRELSNGKDPIEAEKIYNDLIKEVPGTGSWFFDTGKKKQFEVRGEQSGPTNTAWNKLYVDMGKQDAMSLLEAVRLQTGREPTPADVESFAQEMGGYSALKEGGPVHNAMLTLNRANFRVTLQNIRDVLKQTNGTGIAE